MEDTDYPFFPFLGGDEAIPSFGNWTDLILSSLNASGKYSGFLSGEYTHNFPRMPERGRRFIEMSTSLKLYYCPIVIFFGSIGNILSILNIMYSSLRENTAGQFTLAFLCSNTLFLVSLLPEWLALVDFQIYHTDAWCQAMYLLNSMGNFLSIWFMACLCLERLVLISVPQSTSCDCPCRCYCLRFLQSFRGLRCSMIKAKVCIAGFVILSIVVYFNMSLMIGSIYGRHACMPFFTVIPAYHYLNLADIVVNVAVPYILIGVLGVVLTIDLRRVCIMRRRCTAVGTHFHIPRQQIQATKTALCLMVSFMVLSLPLQSWRIYNEFERLSGAIYQLRLEAVFWQTFFHQLFNTSVGFNVFVLLVACCNFRKACRENLESVHKLWCWFKNKRKKTNIPLRAFEFSYQFSYGLVQLQQETSLI